MQSKWKTCGNALLYGVCSVISSKLQRARVSACVRTLLHTHCTATIIRALAHTPAFCRSRIRLRSWRFSHGITAAGGEFDIERCTRKMFVHRNRKRNLLVLLYLKRKYKKRERQYWIPPILAVRYLEGSFYTLFEKLKSHDSKFFNYFRMSVSTFEFLVMLLSDRIKGQDTPLRACVPPKEMLAVTIR